MCVRVCVCVREFLPIFYSQIEEQSPFVSHETTEGFRLTNEFLCVLINQASETHAHTKYTCSRAHVSYCIG